MRNRLPPDNWTAHYLGYYWGTDHPKESKENRVSVASFHKNGKGGWAIHYRATLRIGRAITLSLFEIPSSSGQAEKPFSSFLKKGVS